MLVQELPHAPLRGLELLGHPAVDLEAGRAGRFAADAVRDRGGVERVVAGQDEERGRALRYERFFDTAEGGLAAPELVVVVGDKLFVFGRAERGELAAEGLVGGQSCRERPTGVVHDEQRVRHS